jgi:DNA-directed RNA polymerase alpha subunit
MYAYEVKNDYIVIAESMKKAVSLWRDMYDQDPVNIRKIANYVIVGLEDTQMPISCLNVPERVINVLTKLGIKTAYEASIIPKSRLMSAKHFGESSYASLANALVEIGYSVKDA